MRKIFAKLIISSLALVFFYSFIPTQVFAKKKIPLNKVSTQVVTKTTSNNRLIIKPKLRSDRKALTVNFSNLGAVSLFTYELTYTANGISQGVAGTVTPSGQASTQRELLFGTCSRNVAGNACRYHTGIKDAKLSVTSTLNAGKKVRKTFRIKI